eukprot:evm.model.scf_1788.1 EVM.evm.TU.scf_1788.1   scf_1788:3151-14212(-)
MPEGPASQGAAQLSREAQELWLARRYDDCVRVLEELRAATPNDPKVQHNILIANQYRSGSRDVAGLLQPLSEVKVAIRNAQGQADGGNTGCLGPEGEATLSAVYMLTADESVVTLNMAIVHYQCMQLNEVVSLLTPLFQRIGPLDDGTALRVCLLLLDACIHLEDTDLAQTVLHQMERTYGKLFKSDDRDFISDLMADGEKEGPEAGSYGPPGVNGDSTSSSIDETDSLAADTRGLFLPSVSRSATPQAPASPSAMLKNGDTQERAQNVDNKVLVHLYRARLLLKLQNVKAMKRELKCVLDASPGNVPALFLKAQMEYSKGNYRKAGKILAHCVAGNQDVSCVRVAALCDMGVIYHQLGKQNLACLCFTNSLKQLATLSLAEPSNQEAAIPDQGTLHHQRLQLMYNTGLQHLMIKHYSRALECFRDSMALLCDKAILWLRMGECCIGLYRQDQQKAHKARAADGRGETQGPVVTQVFGEQGSSQLLILPPGSDRGLGEGLNSTGIKSEEAKNHGATDSGAHLAKAVMYLRNAMCILDRQERQLDSEEVDGLLGQPVTNTMMDMGSGKGTSVVGGGSESVRAVSVGSSIQQREELSIVRQSVLVNLAFVQLLQDQPELALGAAESLMLIPNLMRHVSLLAHCYAAEALCMLDRPTEAADQLGMYMAQLADDAYTPGQMGGWPANGATDPGMDSVARDNRQCENSEDVAKLTGPSARATLYVNLASVYATQGELLQAQQCARRAIAYDHFSTQALLILVYVELAQGNHETALALMRREKLVQ